MDIEVSADGTLKYDRMAIRCALGRSGVRVHKVEGDGATPTGCFALRRVLFRPDRVKKPDTNLPIQPITLSDGWCDAPQDPNYNKPVTMPYPASAESLWRKDELYDVVVILGHNDDPPIPGTGSAIFLHVARSNYEPTEGCVAIALPDLIALLKICRDKDRICISAAPADQI